MTRRGKYINISVFVRLHPVMEYISFAQDVDDPISLHAKLPDRQLMRADIL